MTICYNNYFVIISDITSRLKETPNEHELFNLLIDTGDIWYDIGLTLQVDQNDLDDLIQSEDNHLTKLRKVINCWKDTQPSPVIWKTIITAMESPVINKKMIADRIRQYLKLG